MERCSLSYKYCGGHCAELLTACRLRLVRARRPPALRQVLASNGLRCRCWCSHLRQERPLGHKYLTTAIADGEAIQ